MFQFFYINTTIKKENSYFSILKRRLLLNVKHITIMQLRFHTIPTCSKKKCGLCRAFGAYFNKFIIGIVYILAKPCTCRNFVSAGM